MTNTEWLRARLLRGVDNSRVGTLPPKKVITLIENYLSNARLVELENHAHARVLMGYYRYEQADDMGLSYEDKVKLGMAKPYFVRLQDKLMEYTETGNLEMIVDCYNYCRLEYSLPSHPLAHFESKERHGL